MNNYLDKTPSLTPELKRIINDKATEYPNTGKYNALAQKGSYLCRRCGLALFRAERQFHSGCGWPAFDQSIIQSVKELPDVDGRRTEIVCDRCHAHLGHVFYGEQYTASNYRHCVNSASLDFVADEKVMDSEEAIVAGGCFWGVEHFMLEIPGVLAVESGYTGGLVANPTYEQVCNGSTGHYEAVRIVYDKDRTDYETIIKRFFEIHDPTQASGQGPDIGSQYRSAVFCYNDYQFGIAQALISRLENKGYKVATRLLAVTPFWPAEEYHQNYYAKHQKAPYCHRPEARFG